MFIKGVCSARLALPYFTGLAVKLQFKKIIILTNIIV